MELPFSESAFLDVFGAYNERWWPVVIALWVVSLIIAARLRRRQGSDRSVMVLLAVHWLWSGVVYHWLHFRAINPAAAVLGIRADLALIAAAALLLADTLAPRALGPRP